MNRKGEERGNKFYSIYGTSFSGTKHMWSFGFYKFVICVRTLQHDGSLRGNRRQPTVVASFEKNVVFFYVFQKKKTRQRRGISTYQSVVVYGDTCGVQNDVLTLHLSRSCTYRMVSNRPLSFMGDFVGTHEQKQKSALERAKCGTIVFKQGLIIVLFSYALSFISI